MRLLLHTLVLESGPRLDSSDDKHPPKMTHSVDAVQSRDGKSQMYIATSTKLMTLDPFTFGHTRRRGRTKSLVQVPFETIQKKEALGSTLFSCAQNKPLESVQQ